METFGQFIERLRRARGETQDQFAEHFGVSQGTVSSWIKDGQGPSKDSMVILAGLTDELTYGELLALRDQTAINKLQWEAERDGWLPLTEQVDRIVERLAALEASMEALVVSGVNVDLRTVEPKLAPSEAPPKRTPRPRSSRNR